MIALSLLLACTSPDTDPADTGAADEVLVARATLDPRITGLVRLSWDAGGPGTSWVAYGLDGALDQRTPELEVHESHHELVLVDVKAGQDYACQAFTRTAEGELLSSPVQTVQVGPPPRELVPMRLTEHQDGLPQGFVLTSQLQQGQSWVVILDLDGDVVWALEAPPRTSIPAVAVSEDGQLVRFSLHAQSQEDDVGEVVELRLDGRGDEVHTRTYNGHHAFVSLPGDRVGRLSLQQQDVDIEGEAVLTSYDRIIEVDKGHDQAEGYEVVYDFLQDYPVPPGPEILDRPLLAGAADWSHSNSLAWLPSEEDGGDYLLGARNLDAILRIDADTGELLWELGGARSDFALEPSEAFSHGHFSQVWEGGLLMMDNRQAGEVSRVVEYAWDEEEGTAHAVWEHPHPEGAWLNFLGDARRLPDGHTLVSWSSQGTLELVTPEGEVVWRLQMDAGGAFGRVVWLPEL